MSAVATFNEAYWAVAYPEFSYLGLDQVQIYFDIAGDFHNNSGFGPCKFGPQDPNRQSRLVHLMTAHICKLFAPGPTDQAGNTQPSSDVVGRISSATEGSVSVQTENDYPPGTAQWYQQTKYGSMYYAATAPYRTGFWVGPRRRRPGMGLPWQYPTSAGWPF